jgi:DNA-binding transcriptional ArsR family regulator
MPVDEEAPDRAFAALGDPVRRAIVARLSRGEATVNELAEPFAITKQAISRHIRVLEQAGLITRSRDQLDRRVPAGDRTQLPAARRRPGHPGGVMRQHDHAQPGTPSVEARDEAAESGMSTGITQSFERLDAVLGEN